MIEATARPRLAVIKNPAKRRKIMTRIALATEDDRGLEATLSGHFGRCPYYTIVEVDGGETGKVETVANPFFQEHGDVGQVPGFINDRGVEVMIAGGMGPRAVDFFEQFGIKPVTGAAGSVREVVAAYLGGSLGGAAPCSDSHH
jgi:predicted Fe-Mo cluster-binding NifX family protein